MTPITFSIIRSTEFGSMPGGNSNARTSSSVSPAHSRTNARRSAIVRLKNPGTSDDFSIFYSFAEGSDSVESFETLPVLERATMTFAGRSNPPKKRYPC